jgi:hypothetical protein
VAVLVELLTGARILAQANEIPFIFVLQTMITFLLLERIRAFLGMDTF